MRVDLAGIQATVVRQPRRPLSRHLLFRFGGRDGARAFLAGLAGRVTMAGRDAADEPVVGLGIAVNGLRAMDVDPALIEALDMRYRADPDAARLGDAAGTPSDPATWWEGGFQTAELHCVVQVYAQTGEELEGVSSDVLAHAAACGVGELLPRRDGSRLDGRSLGGAKLHFGYTDGISRVDVAWDDEQAGPAQLDFRDFVLGYATEEHDSAPESGPAADLVRDSSYGVLRWIYQDVAGFNRFLAAEGPARFPGLPPAAAEERLAAKLMGRWRDGTPLVLSPEHPDPALAASDEFLYEAQDPEGRACPFSAHIRVMNPRDQPLGAVIAGIPRVLRRGTPYGPPLEGAEDDERDRGIIGVFLTADLARVYTLTRWANHNDFSPRFPPSGTAQDALLGNRSGHADPSFAIPGEGTVDVLPAFIRTKGTALLLYAGRGTLRALAG